MSDVTNKADRADLNRLAEQVAEKSNRLEVDQAFSNLHESKSDAEKRLTALEVEIESTMREVTRDVEDIKQQVVTSLSKKADYVLIERLREQTLKKVDQDYLH